jgi:hypothetical protein
MANRTVFASINGSALTLKKGYPKCKRSGPAWEVTYAYSCGQQAALGLIPSPGDACPLTGFSDLVLTDASVDAAEMPGMADIVLTYKAVGSSVSFPSPGDESQEAVGDIQEVAIDDARLVAQSFYTQAQIDDLKKNGQATVPIGSVNYTKTEYRDNFSWAESDIVSSVGKVENPDGITSPTAGAWMNQGTRIRTAPGGTVEFSKTWKYHALGWQ